jgi:hypothetical protein
MPRDNEGAAPVGPYVQFAEGMSEEEVQHTMASLVALNGRFNTLMGKLEETAAARFPPEETEWRQEAIEIAALRLVMEFLKGCDPHAERVVNNLFRPLVGRLLNDLARKRSIRSDGVRQKPAEYVLASSIWKADCAAAADVLICSKMSHERVKAWLRQRLVRYRLSGHATAERVLNWRDEIVERLPAFRRLDKTVGDKKPLDLMAEVFMQRRPTRERLSQVEAERLADEWLRNAQINVQ